MGGVMSITRENLAGHISRQETEKLGWWCCQTFERKSRKKPTILNTYWVCKAQKDPGAGTIRSQQVEDLLEEHGKHLEPREQLLIDLQAIAEEVDWEEW